MKRIVLIFSALLLLSSCQLIDRIFKGEVVARLGTKVLHESEIAQLIPNDASPEDSVRIVKAYINSWATKHLLLSMAEGQLSKEQKDVQKELDDYRSSLLVFRYQKIFVEQRLDTLITDSECKKYYEENTQSFIAPYSIIKARCIKINTSSPNLQVIKSLYRSTMLEDVDALREVCYSSAEKYMDFDNEWIPITVIARELDMDVDLCESELKKKPYIEKDFMGSTYLLFVYDRVAQGALSPYQYNEKKIKDIILSKRKQELILNLERNLLNDALDDNKLVIYNKKKNE